MPEFILYNAPQSTCSQRVRFVLHAKGIPFEEHKLDLFTGDQLKPDYLAINPNGVVPTLLHDGVPIVDSAVIIEYLDELRPEPEPLRPANLIDLAHLRSLMRFIDEVPTPAVRVPTYNIAFLPHYRDMSEADFAALAESKPLRKDFLLSMGRSGFPERDMSAALDRLRRAVVRMDEVLAARGGPWLMGAQLTLADISLMPIVVRMDDINLGRLWSDRPAIPRWLDRIRAHPAFRPTYYFGSLLTEKYPHLAATRAPQ